MEKKKKNQSSSTKKTKTTSLSKNKHNNNNNNNNNNSNEYESDEDSIGNDGIPKSLQIEDFELKNQNNIKEWVDLLKQSNKIQSRNKSTYTEISRKHSHIHPDIPLKKYKEALSFSGKKENMRGNYLINSEIEAFFIKNTNLYNPIIRLCLHLNEEKNRSSYIALIQSDMIKNRGLFFKYFKKYKDFCIGVIDVHMSIFFSAIIFKYNENSDLENVSNPETIICDVVNDNYANLLRNTVKFSDMFFFCCDCVEYEK